MQVIRQTRAIETFPDSSDAMPSKHRCARVAGPGRIACPVFASNITSPGAVSKRSIQECESFFSHRKIG
ncbi:hypothetical protein WI58_33780 [Burkholderia cepacia]|nr:hypothetical protein WI48_20110 [Burkholderia cepacia]KVA55936.1 hypothetical protein WI49_33315 [Burkholderia cepacia]KVA79234.1 hypothetical protein WI50_28090 [Burkholderia cepacia]KVA83221.1 hypothetical protein WI52_16930 [Burkholderia cepacia]KVA91632.1 hypothetical protein WI51_08830 [Burkholderia cepacia]